MNDSIKSFNVDDNIVEAVRKLLNSDNIKLWEEPYTSSIDGGKLERPTKLIKKYSETLNLSENLIEVILEQLRSHSVAKLSAKKKFQESGIATLFITLMCATSSSKDNGSSKKTEEIVVETSLKSTVNELMQQILTKTKESTGKLKLISLGRCLVENNLSKVLAICLSDEDSSEILTKSTDGVSNNERVERTKKATEMLVTDDLEEDYSLMVADQNGKSFDLPISERKALAVAMMLHEKGKLGIKNKNYGLALVYLLEADVEFEKCTSQLLDMVDNYALLCLDIVWCYFMLQQVSALPDAERRLNVGESKLLKSYGANLERVKQVRGDSSQELAILLRLHLMLGVLHYYKADYNKSNNLLNLAENELKSLHVNKEDMMTVMEMGYSEQEARLALRFCKGNIPRAIEHIMTQKQEKRKIEEAEKEEKMKKKMAKILGHTNAGQLVDWGLYKNLTSMGFNKGATLHALKVHDNDLMLAIQFLQENPDLQLPDPEHEIKKKTSKINITDEMLAQLSSLGFDPQTCLASLHHFKGDLEKASAELLNLNGSVPMGWFDDILTNQESSSSLASSTSSENADTTKEEKKKFLKDEIVDELQNVQESDYLDLSLDEEANILAEFKAKLASIQDA